LPHILLVDNYDSFTYNLAHYLELMGVRLTVCFNDQIDITKLSEYDGVILSPGPGLPQNAGQMPELVRGLLGKIPILGVCLGMQCLAEQLGGELFNQMRVKHGVQETILLDDSLLFLGLDKKIQVGLYHSWAVYEKGDFRVTSRSLENRIMSLENLEKKCFGVQFHPESILTPEGVQILQNFVRYIETSKGAGALVL